MKICIISKFPPIQGGVSTRTYWMAYALAKRGDQVWVVTNADEAEADCRMAMTPSDKRRLHIRFANGGSVRCVSSERPAYDLYVPWANPYVTKLASMATDIVREHSCDLIYAYYLEPYGMAASLAAQWTGVPCVLAHAGSDISVLMTRPWLRTSYAEILKRAHRVVTAKHFDDLFVGLGVKKRRLYHLGSDSLPTHCFRPGAPRLDVNERLAEALAGNDWLHACFRESAPKTFDPRVPTLGMYGKIDHAKGMFDFIRALGMVKRRGVDVQAIMMCGGAERSCRELAAFIRENRVEENVWLLPFMPNWVIPSLINATTATCFLERDFFIDYHTPGVPREVLACGNCLVLSGDIHKKRGYKEGLVDEENCLLVRDPRDHEALASKLEWVARNPGEAEKLGRRGLLLSRMWEDFDEYMEDLHTMFHGFVGA